MPKGIPKNGINTGRFKKGQIPHNKGKKFPEYSGKNSPTWKGGKIKNRGYVYILKPNHPFCDSQGYIKRANLVMEKHLGRHIILPEIIHHKGTKYPLNSIENKGDDRFINLMLFANNSKHTSYHSKISHPRCHLSLLQTKY